MATSPSRFTDAVLVGITLSSAFVGANLALSYLAVPSLLLTAPSKSQGDSFPNNSHTSQHLARQWRSIYSRAMPIAVTGSAVSSASFVYAALQLPSSQSGPRRLLFAAASMAVLVMPYTLILMNPTNFVLMDRAKAGDAVTQADERDETQVGLPKARGLNGYRTDELLQRWAMLNYGRATIPLVGVCCAIAALLW